MAVGFMGYLLVKRYMKGDEKAVKLWINTTAILTLIILTIIPWMLFSKTGFIQFVTEPILITIIFSIIIIGLILTRPKSKREIGGS